MEAQISCSIPLEYLLRTLRSAVGLTQREMSKKIGVSTITYQNLELNKTKMKTDVLETLKKEFPQIQFNIN